MYQDHRERILRCEHCNKPFDQQASLKRHGYYCRSRNKVRVPRTRSCIMCAKLKARCDNTEPACSRCMAKGLDCQYPSKSTVSKVNHSKEHHAKHQIVTPPSPEQSPIDEDERFKGSAFAVTDVQLATSKRSQIDWGTSNINFLDAWDSISTDAIDQFLQMPTQDTIWSPTSVNLQPVSANRSIVPRPKPKPSTRRTSVLILHVLKSYLLMLERSDTLPPFIHPLMLSYSASGDIDIEYLTNCISLMRMIGSGVQGSRELFWRNVRMECERILAENLRLSKWQLLSGMQALSVYILILIDEGETDHNNIDSVLIAAVIAVAQQLNKHVFTSSNPEAVRNRHDLATRWKDWIFEESAIRLGVIYQVVNMLFYFEPAAMCDRPSDLILAPLPAKKGLWEAKDEFAWGVECEKEHRSPLSFGLAADGELIKIRTEHACRGIADAFHQILNAGTPVMEVASWEDWCSGIDDFGGLIMLAASLVG